MELLPSVRGFRGTERHLRRYEILSTGSKDLAAADMGIGQ